MSASETEAVSSLSDSESVILMNRKVIDDNKEIEGVKESPEESKSASTPSFGLRKELTLFSTVTFVIGKIIGSGIFITPSRVLRYSGSFGLTLILWSLGGLFAICGGLCYVELGNMIRNSGAEYAYLKESYSFKKKRKSSIVFGNLLGFLFSWSYSFFIRPSATAVIMLAFGRYFAQAMAGGDTPPDVAVKLCSIAAFIFISLVNAYSLRATAMLINITSVAKVLALIFITGLGVWQLIKGDHSHNLTSSFEDTSPCVGEIVLAFYSVLFSYEGWNGIGYTVEENKNVKRNLLLGIFLGVPCVTSCYVLVNIAYFAGLSKSQVLSSPATALTLAQSTIGDAGLVLIPLMVAVSTIGAATGAVYAGSRVMYTTARDGNLIETLSLLHNKFQTPVMALIVQGLLTCLLIVIGSIGHLIDGLTTLMWVFYGLVFVGLLVMRFTRRQETRPFKVWFPVPVMMIFIAVFLIFVPIILVPEERLYFLLSLMLFFAGIPVYLLLVWDRLRPKVFSKITDKLNKVFMLLLDSSLPATAPTTSTEIITYTAKTDGNVDTNNDN